MRFHLDRDMPVSLATQLVGQIEYAIACGDLEPGRRLPAMRDLAAELGISPVTVAGVYQALGRSGLVVSRVGDGTYVTGSPGLLRQRAAREEALEHAVDQLIRVADHHGLNAAELVQRVQLRHAWHDRQAVRLLFVGIFPEATRAYADYSTAWLSFRDTVDATVIADLRDGAAPAPLDSYDAVLTIGFELATVKALVADAAPVVAVPFLPSDETRTRLAQLQPGDHVVAVATYAQYMGSLKLSVERFAPHVTVASVVTAGSVDENGVVGHFDAVVYATGSDHILPNLPRAIPRIEYRHVPDARAVGKVVRDVLAEREGRSGPRVRSSIAE